MQERVLHPDIFLKDRGHHIDLYVLEPCARLWAAGIRTFFSCQGGPQIVKGKLKYERAMVVVRQKDAKRVCKLLSDLNAKSDQPLLDWNVSVKFDASEAAKNIPIIVEQTIIQYDFGRA